MNDKKPDPFADIRDKRIGDLDQEQTDRSVELWLRLQIGPSERYWYPLLQAMFRVIDRLRKQKPIDMILHCPNCGMQHIDEPEGEGDDEATTKRLGIWTNPPHRSHLCHGCGHIWRPADVPTNGVAEIKTKGKNDSPEPNYDTQNEAQGYAMEAIWQFCPKLAIREDGRTLMTPVQVETVLRGMGWRPPSETRHDASLREMLRAEVDRLISASDAQSVYEKCAKIAEAHGDRMSENPASVIADVIRKAAEGRAVEHAGVKPSPADLENARNAGFVEASRIHGPQIEATRAAYNAVIDFAIEQGLEASTFLRAWREGDTSEWPKFVSHVQ